ncbi:MAG: hypothetical protein DBX37_05025 [Massilioclostridium sp.]|nr:MAG: hypothetical protein DBX37_05025 [Massilioclostridium sp.]
MKKRITAIGLLLAVSLVCTACFPTGMRTKADLSVTDPSQLSNLPDHYTEQLGDQILVDADILVPDNGSYNIYKAQLTTPDFVAWRDFCYGDKASETNLVRDEMATDPSPYVQSIYDHPEGSVISCSRACTNFAKRFQQREYMFYNTYDGIDAATYLPISSIFPKKDASDVNKEDALQTANDLIHTLQLPVEQDPTVYAFNQDDLNSLLERYGNASPYPDKEEGYFCYYRSYLDHVPIYDGQYTSLDNVMIYGSYLGIAYTLYDFDEAWTGGFYQTTECTQQNIDLISLESALSVVQDYFAGMVDIGPLLINNIELCYLPTPNDTYNNDYTLLPVWRMNTYQFVEDIDWSKIKSVEDIDPEIMFNYKQYFVNANTGEMILTN